MDVWSGRPPTTCVHATSPLALETSKDFALTFYKNKEVPPPPQQKQGSFRYPNRREPYTTETSAATISVNSVIGKAAASCKVCGDKASGYHYGVTSCEGCKGFFRRSIQKQIEYRCLREGKCLVIRLNRNRCQFCRFKKCLAVGMSRDSVRYGRVPKRPRESANTDNMPDLARNVVEPVPVAVPYVNVEEEVEEIFANGVVRELVKAVTEAHTNNNAYTEELRTTLQHQTIVFKPNDCDNEANGGDGSASSTTDRVSDMRSILWYNVALRMTPAVQHVVEFAKRLPGFQSLIQDDQLILIKLGFFEVWLTRVTRLSTREHIIFEDGTAISQNQLHVIYDAPFASGMMTYIQLMTKLRMTEEEMALYTSALLMCPDRQGLSDPEHIGGLHLAISEAFLSIITNNASSNAAVRIQEFAEATVQVRALGARHNELLNWCRDHWPRLVLPALFSEIFDIPKIEEDAAAAAAAAALASAAAAAAVENHLPTPQVG